MHGSRQGLRGKAIGAYRKTERAGRHIGEREDAVAVSVHGARRWGGRAGQHKHYARALVYCSVYIDHDAVNTSQGTGWLFAVAAQKFAYSARPEVRPVAPRRRRAAVAASQMAHAPHRILFSKRRRPRFRFSTLPIRPTLSSDFPACESAARAGLTEA